jgi:predicted lipoprotein with Yx(FWY)xxD motif
MNLSRLILSILLPVAALGASACGSSTGAGSGPPKPAGGLVTTAQNPTIGGAVLVDRSGMTLYTLSAEGPSHFICTKGALVPGSSSTQCLSLWKPLLVMGGKPTGTVSSLGAVTRPDGVGRQLTYRGMPLYTFTEDRKPGDAIAGGASVPPASQGGSRYAY